MSKLARTFRPSPVPLTRWTPLALALAFAGNGTAAASGPGGPGSTAGDPAPNRSFVCIKGPRGPKLHMVAATTPGKPAVAAAIAADKPARTIAALHPAHVLETAVRSAGTNMAYMSGSSQGQEDGPTRSLSPYFYVAGGDANTERLPLRRTSAEVNVAGPIAAVRLKQTFQNSGSKPIEAVYVFPASTRAAVHAMRMTIGTRVIEAHIDRRAAARATYEAARSEGKRTSLLEQERANVFTTSVANIMPGDNIDVTLDYSELLVPEQAAYEVVVPGVVGPRYTGGADPAPDGRGNQWMANPTLHAGAVAPFPFDVTTHLDTGVPIQEITSPSHKITVERAAPGIANVRLAELTGSGRDYVLRYRLAGERIQGGAVLWPGAQGSGPDGEKFFAVMLQPPRRPAPASIPSREYIFVLDVSGSMHGFPLDTAKTLMRNLLGQLRPTDRFDVVLFSGASAVMNPKGALQATPANIGRAIAFVDAQNGGGGTELMGGLKSAYAVPRASDGVSRTVVVVTDGFVGVEAQAFQFVRQNLDQANLFSFGIGSSVNRALIEGMARAGGGEPFVVLSPDQAAATAKKLQAMIERPVLTRVNVAFKGIDAYDVTPEKLPDVLAERPVVVLGKYRGNAAGSIELTGLTGGETPFRQVVSISANDAHASNGALRELWARHWVAALDDQRQLAPNPALDEGITQLGLGYQLLTAFTSFVAVDSQVVNHGGAGDTVRQPLPMPDGVSDLAVGGVVANLAPAMRSSTGAAYGMGVGGGGLLKKMAMAAPVAAAAPPPPEAQVSRKVKAADKGDLDDLLEGVSAAPAKAPVGPRSSRADRPQVASAGRAHEQRQERDAESVEAKAGGRASGVISRELRIVATSSSSLSDEVALTAAVRQALASAASACKQPDGTRAQLRLTIDGNGRVVSVQTTSGSPALGRYLAKALARVQSAARPNGPTSGPKTATFTLTVEVREIGL